jgi:hypothetical protein
MLDITMLDITMLNYNDYTFAESSVKSDLTLANIKASFRQIYKLSRCVTVYAWVGKFDKHTRLEDDNMSAETIINKFSNYIYMDTSWPDEMNNTGHFIKIHNKNDDTFFRYILNENTTVGDIKKTFYESMQDFYKIDYEDVTIWTDNMNLKLEDNKMLTDYKITCEDIIYCHVELTELNADDDTDA